MSEDRFDDLTTGEKLARRDETHPEPVKPPEVPRPGNKYAWLVGILMLMGLGVLLFAQTLPNAGESVQGPNVGQRLPAFAAPAADSDLDGDANVCQERPCPKSAGSNPACELVSEDVVTVCPARDRPLVLTFVVTRGTDCEPQVDRVERVRAQLPEVDFVTVVSGDSREETEALALQRGWEQPVGVDEDGSVVNLYGIGVCPFTVFARDGRVRDRRLGNLTEDELRRRAERLLR